MGGWVGGRSVMADATIATARLLVTWPIPRPPVVWEENIFHLFRYTQPVENYPSLVNTCTSIGFESIVLIPWIQSWRSLSREFISVKLLICGKLSISIFFVAMANAANGDLPTYNSATAWLAIFLAILENQGTLVWETARLGTGSGSLQQETSAKTGRP